MIMIMLVLIILRPADAETETPAGCVPAAIQHCEKALIILVVSTPYAICHHELPLPHTTPYPSSKVVHQAADN